MGLETGTYIADLVVSNPVGATDQKKYGDDHIRLIKSVLKNTFPNMLGVFNRVQTKSTNYTVVPGDNTSVFNCTATLTLSLTDAATLGNGHCFAVYANGGTVTIDPSGSETINGATTLTVQPGHMAFVWCTASGFVALAAATLGANTFTGLQQADASTNITAAATTDLGTATGNSVTVTHASGTLAITSLGGASLQAGTEIETIFSISGGTLSLTHHATNLILAGGANITLANGDVIRWRKMHDSNAEWKMVGGVKANGQSIRVPETIIVAISDESTAITAGPAKVVFRMPFAMTLTDLRASLSTASSSGAPTFDINESGASIISTKLSIDANEKTSTTAATPYVFSDTSLADDAEITIDIDVAGTGAKGAKIYLIGYRT